MIYRIYCLKNKDEKIVYVGQTQRELNIRLSEHKRRFPHRKEYTIHLIREASNHSDANNIETYNISKFDLVSNGENVTYGKGTKGLGANQTSFKVSNNYCKMGTKKVECIETGIIYDSLTKCSVELGLNVSNISDVCKGKRKTTGKLHFKFV